MRRGTGVLSGVLVMTAIIAVWQWRVTVHPVFFLPAPSAIWDRLRTDWLSGPAGHLFVSETAWSAIGQTFRTALAGWVIASCAGIVAGAVIGALPAARDYTGAPLLLLRSTPPIVVVPLSIAVLGVGTAMHLTVVVFGCVWPVLLNAAAGVAEIEPLQVDVARLNHLGPAKRFFRVLLPAAAPKMFAGLRVAMSLAIVLSVGSEMFAGAGGLGGAALQAQNTFDVSALWATLTVLAFFGVLFNALFLLIEKHALRWHVLRRTQ
ncbi:ABC transporter permease [Actinomadura opuntiae]|uniref:ABC transporter permease n=1 Tax=Actinomadura sp. OS1-43 TaxID=604315 RepID=UPI00255A8F21|nr:ABC transporter permease subunit [Actinomadura sp. OS1-43]MDL4814074.1 ABC transporter permease subunit [Actinomadura sp. OS1-43]